MEEWKKWKKGRNGGENGGKRSVGKEERIKGEEKDCTALKWYELHTMRRVETRNERRG